MGFAELPLPSRRLCTPPKNLIPSLQFRGGPQRYEVTGWLQIQGVRVTDEGTYRCFARNKVGEVVAFASLTVFTPGERPSPVPRRSCWVWEGTFGILGTATAWFGGGRCHPVPVLLFQTSST